MTIDKIKHYLSEPLFSHISGLDKTQLQAQKEALTRQIAHMKQYAAYLYAENQIFLAAEMEFINYRLQTQ